MNVIIEKRMIVGTLKTLMGTYSLLDLEVLRNAFDEKLRPLVRQTDGAIVFSVVDDEQFETLLVVHGDFIVIPSSIPCMLDVKRVMTEQEDQAYKQQSMWKEANATSE